MRGTTFLSFSAYQASGCSKEKFSVLADSGIELLYEGMHEFPNQKNHAVA